MAMSAMYNPNLVHGPKERHSNSSLIQFLDGVNVRMTCDLRGDDGKSIGLITLVTKSNPRAMDKVAYNDFIPSKLINAKRVTAFVQKDGVWVTKPTPAKLYKKAEGNKAVYDSFKVMDIIREIGSPHIYLRHLNIRKPTVYILDIDRDSIKAAVLYPMEMYHSVVPLFYGKVPMFNTFSLPIPPYSMLTTGVCVVSSTLSMTYRVLSTDVQELPFYFDCSHFDAILTKEKFDVLVQDLMSSRELEFTRRDLHSTKELNQIKQTFMKRNTMVDAFYGNKN